MRFRGRDGRLDAVGGDERPIGVLAEVVVPGRVDERDAPALQLGLEGSGRDGNATLLFEFHPVRRGMAAGATSTDGTGELDCAGVEQEFLCQRRLARVGVRDDRKGAPPRNLSLDFGGQRGRRRVL